MIDGIETNGLVLAFHGGRAGSGKSFVARQMAVALTQERQRVLLFDLDAQARHDHGVAWGLASAPTVADMVDHWPRFDEQTIKGYFPASKDGVTIAALAPTAQQVLAVTSHDILKALALFQRAYDVVVLDGLQGWDRLTLTLLDASNSILMVASLDLPGLRQESSDLQHYQALKFPLSKIQLILNREDQPGALNISHYQKSLPGLPLLGGLPYCIQAMEVTNLQEPLNQVYPHLGFVRQMRVLAKHLLETIQPAAVRAQTTSDKQIMSAAVLNGPNHLAVKERLHRLLLDHEELKSLAAADKTARPDQAQLQEKVERVVTALMAAEAPEISNRETRETLVQEIVDEVLGLGPLEDLIRDDSVTEILVNHSHQIFIERAGKLELSPKHFLNDKQLMTVIERIVAPLGRRIDESQPYVDARLADGSRVNAIIPPLALKGPTLTIRKFSRQRMTIDDLVALGSLPAEWANFLQACVQGRKNVVIAGGTGSGKTTLLNILTAAIPEEERIITVEDAAELNLPQPHVITLESRPANIEGRGAITIRDLVRNCLRMRPDRIVVGECRGGEALDMLQAMNTGHDGSLTTVHANSPKDTIGRLETMVLLSGLDLPVHAIREQIASAVHLIVQQARLQDGTRKVVQITEVLGVKNGQVALQDLFVFQQTGLNQHHRVQGVFVSTGVEPTFKEELDAKGIAWTAAKKRRSGRPS